MTRRAGVADARGYFAIGVERAKTEVNIGTLWRSADLFGAAYMFTVGHRYKLQSADTMKSYRNIPLLHFATIEEMRAHLPYTCHLVGVELDDRARIIDRFCHPERACYLLGAEDDGLSKAALAACHAVVQLPGRHSMNVASAGSIVLYDRWLKRDAA